MFPPRQRRFPAGKSTLPGQVQNAQNGGTFQKPSQLCWEITTHLDFRIAHIYWCLGQDALDLHHTGPWCLHSNELVALFCFCLVWLTLILYVHIVTRHRHSIARKLWVCFFPDTFCVLFVCSPCVCVGSYLAAQLSPICQRHASKQWFKNDPF